ncbi:MAG: hypothetical protein HYY48_01280 [Gammaproteobacteria bacterium]|nr:hypothetical protein [Gammaproteobacteria bacterium]
MSSNDLILELFGKGLGELLVLHVRREDVCLGNIVLEKGKLIVRDQGLLSGFKPAQFAPCMESGVLGMVAAFNNQIWESLTFFGLNYCNMPQDLSRTRHGALTAAQDQYGDSLIEFIGSVYRGYQLMLDHHFLPVVLLKEIQSKEGLRGLAVCDLRVVPMDLAVIRRINDVVRKSVEKQLSLDVQDVEVITEEFDKLFPGFVAEPVIQARSERAPLTALAPAPKPAPAKPAPPVAKPGPAARRQETSSAPGPATASIVPLRSVQAEKVAPVQELAPVIRLLKVVAAEIGDARAFEMFERWATDFLSAEVRAMLERQEIFNQSPRRFFDAVKSHFERFGERYSIVEEAPDRIVHEIHGCMYRQACLRVGGINMDKWGTCMQVIPLVRSKAAAVADPNLEWVWNRCDRRSDQPCLYEIRRNRGEE